MKLEIYYTGMSPYARMVELMLQMKGVEFERILPTREFVREGGFGDLSPLRKIPVLMVDGQPVPETQVIMELIEELFPEPALLPADPFDRAKARLLARIADIYVSEGSVKLLNNAFMEKSDDIAANAIHTMQRGLNALEHWIVPGPYAMGDTRTVADCVIAPVMFMPLVGLLAYGVTGLPEMPPKLAAYLEAVRADELIAGCLDGMQQSLDERMAATAK